MIKLRALLITAALSLSVCTAEAEQTLDRIVAVAGQEVVLASELEEEIQRIRARFFQRGQRPPAIEQLQDQVLERLVMQRLQLNHAERAGIRVDDATLDAAVQRIAAQNNLSLGQLRDALAQEGVDFSAFREDLREQITVDRLQQAVIQREVEVSPREIEEAMQAASAQDATEYRVAHIRIATPEGASPAELEEAERRAHEVRQQAVSTKTDFATLAETFSQAASAGEGGVLGWRLPGQLPAGLQEAVEELEPGEISDVEQTANGFHIVKLIDKRREGAQIVQEVQLRQILIEPGEGVTDEDARQRLESFRERILEGESFASLARMYSDRPGSEADGGTMGWVPTDDLPSAFTKHVEQLDPGELSQPFRSSQGWHLVRVEDQRERDISKERRRERIAQQIRERKSQEALNQWLRELREEAYVDYRLEAS